MTEKSANTQYVAVRRRKRFVLEFMANKLFFLNLSVRRFGSPRSPHEDQTEAKQDSEDNH